MKRLLQFNYRGCDGAVHIKRSTLNEATCAAAWKAVVCKFRKERLAPLETRTELDIRENGMGV